MGWFKINNQSSLDAVKLCTVNPRMMVGNTGDINFRNVLPDTDSMDMFDGRSSNAATHNCISRSLIAATWEADEWEPKLKTTDSANTSPSNPSDDPGCYIYSHTIPVRRVNVLSSTRSFVSLLPMIPDCSIANQPTDDALTDTLDAAVLVKASLAQFLQGPMDGYKDVVPIVRALCLMQSLSLEPFTVDPVKYQFVRRFQIANKFEVRNEIVPFADHLDSRIIAVPYDIAVKYVINRYMEQFPEPFQGNSDFDWVMIPIRNTNNNWALYYIISFLTSELWNGTINKVVRGYWLNTDGSKKKLGTISMMPMGNSVHIPGPRHAIIVLMDVMSKCHIKNVNIAGLNVPVWEPGLQVVPAELGQHWHSHYVTANIDKMASGFAAAYIEMCTFLAVSDTCGRAISLASELCHGAYPGFHAKYSMAEKDFTSFGGAWAKDDKATDGNPAGWIDEFSARDSIPAYHMGCDKNARNRLVGFNFSVQTPYHQPPKGSIRITYKVNPWSTSETTTMWLSANWATRSGVKGSAGYNSLVATSLMRLAIASELVKTNYEGYEILGSERVATFLNMTAMALALSTATFLSANDIELRSWMGWRDAIFSELTQSASIFTIVSFDLNYMEDLIKDCICDYYNINPQSNEWAGYSSFPIHAFKQWIIKLNMIPRLRSIPTEYFLSDNDEYLTGVVERPEDGIWKALIPATVDMLKYSPSIYKHIVGSPMSFETQWFEQWSYISTIDWYSNNPKNIESNIYLRSIRNDQPMVNARENFIFVLGSKYGLINDRFTHFYVSPLTNFGPLGFLAGDPGSANVAPTS